MATVLLFTLHPSLFTAVALARRPHAHALRAVVRLVALADLRHFGRAAESCHVSQPTLSTQIKKLEDELGVSLVERAPRHVMLTAAGQDIAMRARRVLAEVDQMRETARRTADPEAGSVRLGLFPTLGPYLLPHVVPRRARPSSSMCTPKARVSWWVGSPTSGNFALPTAGEVSCQTLCEKWVSVVTM